MIKTFYLSKEELITLQPLIVKYDLRYVKNPATNNSGQMEVVLDGSESAFVQLSKEFSPKRGTTDTSSSDSGKEVVYEFVVTKEELVKLQESVRKNDLRFDSNPKQMGADSYKVTLRGTKRAFAALDKDIHISKGVFGELEDKVESIADAAEAFADGIEKKFGKSLDKVENRLEETLDSIEESLSKLFFGRKNKKM